MRADIQKTKEYYKAINDTSFCDCAYCRSYRLQVKSAFHEASEYLETLGVDIEKPFETSPLEPDENGMLDYCCCQYIVFGSCEPSYYHKIDDVEIRIATSYPDTGLEEEHFVLELYPIRLKFCM